MAPEPLTRRRAITIVAATTAGAILGPDGGPATIEHEWRGLAMGADARIVFCGADRATAAAAADMATAEIARLEQALSLFRADSEICRLNRDAILRSPSHDLRRALVLGLAIAELTGGLFDPTVQALWESYVDWFAADPHAGLPPASRAAAARALVDWRRITLDAESIALGPGQRVTLNGLGQGYVTDRVAELLRRIGFVHVLVDLGEQRVLGPRPGGEPWRVARGDEVIGLRDGALATSEGAGCILGAGGEVHHLFDPRTGLSAVRWRRVSVHHPLAAVADGLSTALYAASEAEIETVLARLGGLVVWATDPHDRERRWTAPPVVGISL
jgi:thiamine biosynthesis lipoprotein